MLLYGKEMLYNNKIYDFGERIEKVNAVTFDDLAEAIDLSFDSAGMAAAVVGKVKSPLVI